MVSRGGNPGLGSILNNERTFDLGSALTIGTGNRRDTFQNPRPSRSSRRVRPSAPNRISRRPGPGPDRPLRQETQQRTRDSNTDRVGRAGRQQASSVRLPADNEPSHIYDLQHTTPSTTGQPPPTIPTITITSIPSGLPPIGQGGPYASHAAIAPEYSFNSPVMVHPQGNARRHWSMIIGDETGGLDVTAYFEPTSLVMFINPSLVQRLNCLIELVPPGVATQGFPTPAGYVFPTHFVCIPMRSNNHRIPTTQCIFYILQEDWSGAEIITWDLLSGRDTELH